MSIARPRTTPVHVLPSLPRQREARAGIAARGLWRPGLAGATAMWLTLAAGAAQTPAPSDNQPVQIQADSGIEWQQNAHLYIARGNAAAIRGPSELHADTLVAHYREA